MATKRAGETVEYTITYLEMAARPKYPRPPVPVGNHALIRAENPPHWYFLDLYRAVGGPYEWTDWFAKPRAEVEGFVSDSRVALYTLMTDGWPAGFFMLDTRASGVCDLAYFGLVPEAIGRGLGTYLLETAIHMAWDTPDTRKVSVNTCTLDHPRALRLYQKKGFEPVRQETARRVLSADREMV